MHLHEYIIELLDCRYLEGLVYLTFDIIYLFKGKVISVILLSDVFFKSLLKFCLFIKSNRIIVIWASSKLSC